MRRLSTLVVTAAAITGLALGAPAAQAKGRHYHTLVSTHHIEIQGCVSVRSTMFLHFDARHAKTSAFVTYKTGVPGHWTGNGGFGAIEGRSGFGGGGTVTAGTVARFRVKVDHVKRATVKVVPVSTIGPC